MMVLVSVHACEGPLPCPHCALVLRAATMVLASEKDVGVGEFIRMLQVTARREIKSRCCRPPIPRTLPHLS